LLGAAYLLVDLPFWLLFSQAILLKNNEDIMRIGIFAETFLPKIDGITNTLCHLLEHLEQRGHQALMFAPKGGPSYYAGTEIVGLPAIPLPLYPELKLVPPIVTGVDERLAEFAPDLVHVVNPFLLGVVGIQAGRAVQVPIVASYHTDLPGYTERWGLSFSKELFWTYTRWIHNQADLNLCPSHYTLAELHEQGFEHLKVWGRGVDNELYNPAQYREEMRARLSDGHPEQPLLLYVGRLAIEKRVDWLHPVISNLENVRLAVVGDGPLRDQLEPLFEGTNTIFTGYLAGEDLAAAYASSDIFVFPAANETLGNVVLEAMASGLPVIAPDAGGVTDHVTTGKTGILFPAEEQGSFIQAVTQLLCDPATARKWGQAGRAHAEANSWPVILDGLLNNYQELLEGQSTLSPASSTG
jgi:phosphatidylinositol alpha 1,6-mannosyltransferase